MSARRWRGGHAVAVLGVCVALAAVGVARLPGQAAYADEPARPHVVFRIATPQITESSSLALSTVEPGLVYTTNDSGDDGAVYTLDAKTGALVGRTTLTGADPLDVEAIAVVPDGTLIVADIGDNNAEHSTADLYRIPQPGRGEHAATPDRVDLTYVGGPRDAESVLYDARTGTAYVVSKALAGARVYATPPHVFDLDNARLRPVADAPTLATDATFLPGGDFVVIRTYSDATVYAYPSWDEVATFDLPLQQQGESITAPRSGGVVWVGSEGDRSRVLAVPLPPLSNDASSSPSTPGGSSTGSTPGGASTSDGSADASGSSSQEVVRVVFVVSVAALLALLAGLVIVALTRRSPR